MNKNIGETPNRDGPLDLSREIILPLSLDQTCAFVSKAKG